MWMGKLTYEETSTKSRKSLKHMVDSESKRGEKGGADRIREEVRTTEVKEIKILRGGMISLLWNVPGLKSYTNILEIQVRRV